MIHANRDINRNGGLMHLIFQSRWLSRIGTGLDYLLLITAMIYLLFSDMRTPLLKAGVGVAFFTHSALVVYDAWKFGLLSKNISQIHENLRKVGIPPRRTFERAATFIGFIAMGFIFWA